MARNLSLFESSTKRGRIVRQGDLVQIIMDGGGAVVAPMQDFIVAQKWAQAKPASGNPVTDRGRFLEQLPVLVARPGSFAGTRGNERQLATVARLMRQAGYDLGEWMLPPELKAQPKLPDALAGKKKDAEPAAEAPDAEADPDPDPDRPE